MVALDASGWTTPVTIETSRGTESIQLLPSNE